MVRSGNAIGRLAVPIIAAGLLISTSGVSALGNESNCRRLEDLAQQYAGVQLTSQQQKLKRKLVSWYQSNCKRTRNAEAQR